MTPDLRIIILVQQVDLLTNDQSGQFVRSLHVRYDGGSKTATSVLISFQAEFANNVQRIVPNHCATRKGNLAESLSGFFGPEFWHALSCQRFSAFLGLQRSGDIFSQLIQVLFLH